MLRKITTDINTLLPAILNFIIAASPSAFIALDNTGNIIYITTSDYSTDKLQVFKGKNFFNILRRLMPSSYQVILKTFEMCREHKCCREIPKTYLYRINGDKEYHRWNISPINGDLFFIYARNITENILIEEEFSIITEEHAKVQQNLSVAMTKLDFQFMDLEQAHKRLSVLYSITSIVQRTVNRDEVLSAVLKGITKYLGFSHAAIFLVDDTNKMIKLTSYISGTNNSISCQDVCEPLNSNIISEAIAKRTVIYSSNNITTDDKTLTEPPSLSEVGIPLIVGDKVLGVLNIEATNEKQLEKYDLDLLKSLASHIAMTIEHAESVRRSQHEAITDGLTGLFNRRHFMTLLDIEMKRSLRYTRPLSLIIFDIDFFKNFNDKNGHLLGDQALSAIAEIAKDNCRDVDVIARYGGEEFVILLPETEISEAYHVANRLREAIAIFQFEGGQNQPSRNVTISAGIATFPHLASNSFELLYHADMALYKAKETKNKVIVFKH